MRGRILKRSPGSWTIVYDGLPDPATGHRRQLSRAVKGPRREAERILAEVLAQRDRGLGLRPDRLTVANYLTSWCSGLPLRVRPSTAARYGGIVRIHLIPHLGATRLVRLTTSQVNEMLAACLEAGCAPRTVSHIRAVLRTALNDAVRADLISRNVAALANPPRVSVEPLSPVTVEEAQAILAATEGTWLGPIVATGLYTGLRQGEILGLRWSDVDLTLGQLRVNVALQRLHRQFRLVEPKSASSRRAVPLPPPLRPVLAAHRVRQVEARLAAGSAGDEEIHDLVFTTSLGSPLDGTHVTWTFQAVCRRAGLARRRFHDLRHGTATLLLAAGVDLKTISTILGHSTITLTANTYAGVVPTLTTDAMRRLGAILTPSASDAP